MCIKERLRIVIKSQNLTVKDFAEMVNTPLRTVHNYLNSGKEPSVEFLSKVSDKFNVNLNWLLLNKGEIYISSSIDLTLNEYELLNIFDSLNESGKKILINISKLISLELRD